LRTDNCRFLAALGMTELVDFFTASQPWVLGAVPSPARLRPRAFGRRADGGGGAEGGGGCTSQGFRPTGAEPGGPQEPYLMNGLTLQHTTELSRKVRGSSHRSGPRAADPQNRSALRLPVTSHLAQLDHQAYGLVSGSFTVERFAHIGMQENEVAPRVVALRLLPAHAT
jgi:hypothetical protein